MEFDIFRGTKTYLTLLFIGAWFSKFSCIQCKFEEQFIFQLIGRTPLVYLNKVTEGCGAYIAVKQEMMQPTASIKDRLPYPLSISNIPFIDFDTLPHQKFYTVDKSQSILTVTLEVAMVEVKYF
jgi:hypothetical protein